MIQEDRIQVFGDFDGGNPKDPLQIMSNGHDSITVIPFSEDNDPNYKFRLDVQVINNGLSPTDINLTIDWKEGIFNLLRDYIYRKSDSNDSWVHFKMEPEGTQAHGVVTIMPGVNYLCLNPKYNYKDYLSFLKNISISGFIHKEMLGHTAGGRELWSIKISKSSPESKRKMLFVSRLHPYETGGSYCAEGVVRHFLNSNSDSYHDLLARNDIFLIPMANPDGVFEGLCKLSGINGINLAREIDEHDQTSFLIKQYIDRIKPNIYCEFHNWMYQDNDGIFYLNWLAAKKFIKRMPSQRAFNKDWAPSFRKKFLSLKPPGFKKYCREKYDSLILALEYPWAKRSTRDMRKLGVDTMNALIL